MTHFYFKKMIRDRGRQGLIGTLIFTAVFAAMDFYLLHQPLQIGHIVGTWFAGLLTLISSLMTLSCIVMLNSKEGWIIEITDQEIRWTAPKKTEETSFILAINEVSELRCITSTNAYTNMAYELVNKSGDSQTLRPSLSGVNMDKFIACLEQQGVAIVHTTN